MRANTITPCISVGMPVPVILGVGVRAQRAEAPGNRDEALDPRGGVRVHARVARVEQRLPSSWARLGSVASAG